MLKNGGCHVPSTNGKYANSQDEETSCPAKPSDATWVTVAGGMTKDAACDFTCPKGEVKTNLGSTRACATPGTGIYSVGGNPHNCWTSESDSATELTNRGGASGWASPQPTTVTTATDCQLAGCTANDKVLNAAKTKCVTFPSVSIAQYRFIQSPTGHYNLSLKGECSEKNRPVTITITSGRSISTKPSCDSKGEWKISFSVTNFPIGSISITADHESATKIKAPQAQKTVSKSVPTVFISNHTISSQISGSISLAGACSEVNRPILLKLSNGIYNLVPSSPICKSHNYWTTIINIIKLPLGTISVTADHETADGTKATQAQYSFQKEDPTVELILFVIQYRTNKSFFLLSGDCSEVGREVTVRIGGKEPTSQPICGDLLQWSTVVDGTSVPVGNTSITLEHSHSVTKKIALSMSFKKPGPTVSIISRAPDKKSTGVLKVHGACSENSQEVTVSIGGASPSTQPTCTSGAWEAEVDFGSDSDIPTGAVSITANHSSSDPSNPAARQAQMFWINYTCPAGFIPVPPLSGYTIKFFCVAKYEMKNDPANLGTPVSQPSENPWVSLSRNAVINRCTEMGGEYDLINNNEWQTLARNIEQEDSNWSQGHETLGSLSQGHSFQGKHYHDKDNSLPASGDDNEPCKGLLPVSQSEPCDASHWRLDKRTHTLLSGEVIWDMAGNVWEWMKEDGQASYGKPLDTYAANIRYPSLIKCFWACFNLQSSG